MLRGYFFGGIWGLLVAAIGLTSASLLAPQPPGNAPPAAPQIAGSDVAEGAFDAAATADASVAQPVPATEQIIATDLAPTPHSPAPQAVVPAVEPAAVIADTQPAEQPATSQDSVQPEVPDQLALTEPAATPETPVLPNPQAAAPQTPVAETDLTLATEPAVPAAIAEPVEETVVVDEPVLDVEPAPAAEDTIAVIVAPSKPEPAPKPDVIAQTTANPLSDSPPADPVVDPGAEPQPVVLPDPIVEPGVDTELPAPPPVAPPPIAPPVAEITVVTPPPARIVLQGDAASLPQDNSGIRVNRPEDALSETADDTVLDAQIAAPGGPALQEFAADFTNPDGKPLVSIILIDDGAIAGAAAALTGVPFPLTVAMSASGADATDRMAAYRAAGIDVMAMADLPVGAQPTDVEVVMESVFSILPETVALLDIGTGGLQDDQAVTDQAMARLAADGRGIVTVSEGLNMALRSAENAAVPAGVIFRDLDGDGQDARVIRRFLDQAAFQARQETGVILLARLRPDTISALILWGTENRAGQVALAPISATLSQ